MHHPSPAFSDNSRPMQPPLCRLIKLAESLRSHMAPLLRTRSSGRLLLEDVADMPRRSRVMCACASGARGPRYDGGRGAAARAEKLWRGEVGIHTSKVQQIE
eukprot:6194164-Pleurochrysis_carterae.AAC.1